MTTARPGMPYPCSPQAKTRDESSRSNLPLEKYVGVTY